MQDNILSFLNESWATLLGGIIAAFLGALATIYTKYKDINIKQITEERTKWRESIRRITKDIIFAKGEKKIKLLAELETRLNPHDEEDQLILLLAKQDLKQNSNRELFLHSIAIMLKHDWERVKKEAKPFPYLIHSIILGVVSASISSIISNIFYGSIVGIIYFIAYFIIQTIISHIKHQRISLIKTSTKDKITIEQLPKKQIEIKEKH
ncbi:hypothetical protein NYR75_02200 [Actinobacillus equuli subsp. haemolyticus]|uniref:hypothetical protein n=1 Tax=Actinobacillus equuli TaxID=718 RepID=UPI002441D6D2|nr:hypothetical protein [Actinobacillus equuli]WGE63657.1 hypothetical protein NYR75_02200 [Actinobacillus equuli subsp. haemolyticus]WGE65855.1 hypothetical protein NYR76_02535 [Actinobacillus equuli subsp. equuli]WGE74523.1 hypothetical protein NYR81_05770 [Actinobacillus equuli subsp. haemolyticus]WGE77712.1 hypothetical protein NYR82_02225 [Actinobacillus equuli subsp. haemolyticus]